MSVQRTSKNLKMYKYLFGPVPSRRLGMSLGIDLVPEKVCSLDCVYCEVCKTTKLTLARKEYIKIKKIKDEITDYFSNNCNPDFITITGSGEPTLNICIAEIIQFIKQNKPAIPIALLTNGTMFFDEEVRNAIKNTDIVLPSLDAATENVFQRINRPHKNLSINEYIQGLIHLRNDFSGKIWLEVFILPGYNNNKNELSELKKAIQKIKPDLIQLNTLDRPGAIKKIRGATIKELQDIIDFWELDNLNLIVSTPEGRDVKSFRDDIEYAIIETISRRPCTLDDLSMMLCMQTYEIEKYLNVLKEDKLEKIEQDRGLFYRINK